MLRQNSRKLSYLSRQKYVPPEINNIFLLVTQENTKELTSYILDKKTKFGILKKVMILLFFIRLVF